MDKNSQKIDEVKQKILYFAKNQGIKRGELYLKIGMKQSNFSGIGAQSSLKTDNLIKVLKCFPNLNPDWLLLDKGAMLRDQSESRVYSNDGVEIELLRSRIKEQDSFIKILLDMLSKNGTDCSNIVSKMHQKDDMK